MKICPNCDLRYDDSNLHCTEDGSKLVHLAPERSTGGKDPLLGTMLTERIRIDAIIGVGGMGTVYRGEDIAMGRTVAVKVLSRELSHSEADVRRFFNEGRVLARLRHPNTIQVFDFGETPGGYRYIALEFMTGTPLDDYMLDEDFTMGRVFEVLEQLCQALEEAHLAGIVHRDVKPDNIFIDTVNNRRMVKLIDFGIARISDGEERITQAGMVFGTPSHMSPEQAQGFAVDGRSDIYSVGILIYQLLTNSLPFEGEPMEVAVQHVTQDVPPVWERSRFGDLPEQLVHLVHQMLEKDPENRPQTIGDVRDELIAIARTLPDVAVSLNVGTGPVVRVTTAGARVAEEWGTPVPEVETVVEPPPRKRPILMYVGAALLAAVGVVVGVSLSSGGNDDAAAPPPQQVVETPPPAPQIDEVEATPEMAVALAAQFAQSALVRGVGAAQRDTVHVPIQTTPNGAVVRLRDGDRVLGTTPFTWVTSRSAGAVAVVIEKERYATANQQINVAAGLPVTLRMEREGGRERADRPPVNSGSSGRNSEAAGSGSSGSAAEPAAGASDSAGSGSDTANSGSSDSGSTRPSFELRPPVTIPGGDD